MVKILIIIIIYANYTLGGMGEYLKENGYMISITERLMSFFVLVLSAILVNILLGG